MLSRFQLRQIAQGTECQRRSERVGGPGRQENYWQNGQGKDFDGPAVGQKMEQGA
jgi:hypothetical protein